MFTNTMLAKAHAHRWPAHVVRFPLFIVALMASGCGPAATTVTGTVTLDGQVLPEASVQFYPANGKGQPAGTATDSAGRYRATVSPTPQRVVISKREVTGYLEDKTDLVDGGSPIVQERVPARYADVTTTPLIADPVENTGTTIDFSLSSSTSRQRD
jgi:hypothetical protein